MFCEVWIQGERWMIGWRGEDEIKVREIGRWIGVWRRERYARGKGKKVEADKVEERMNEKLD